MYLFQIEVESDSKKKIKLPAEPKNTINTNDEEITGLHANIEI